MALSERENTLAGPVIFDVLSAFESRPVWPRLQTYRGTASSEATGQLLTHALHKRFCGTLRLSPQEDFLTFHNSSSDSHGQ